MHFSRFSNPQALAAHTQLQPQLPGHIPAPTSRIFWSDRTFLWDFGGQTHICFLLGAFKRDRNAWRVMLSPSLLRCSSSSRNSLRSGRWSCGFSRGVFQSSGGRIHVVHPVPAPPQQTQPSPFFQGRASTPWEQPGAIPQSPPLCHPGGISPSKDQLGKRHHPDLSPAWVLPGFIWASFVP